MIYTRYFAGVLQESGTLHISCDQWRRVMNIVYLEGSIQSLMHVKDEEMPYRFDSVIFKYQRQLADLTGNLKPGDLIREMYQLSRN